MSKVAPVAMPRGTISFRCGQVYSSGGGQFLGSAEAVVGKVGVSRPYYPCPYCHRVNWPADVELDVENVVWYDWQ